MRGLRYAAAMLNFANLSLAAVLFSALRAPNRTYCASRSQGRPSSRPVGRCGRAPSRSGLLATVLLGALSVLTGCPQNDATSDPVDLGITPPADGPLVVGLYADCTPAGFSDVVCRSDLRCGFVRVGDPPYQGTLTKCVPIDSQPLGENEVCQFDQGAMSPTQSEPRRYDRCARGLGCVETETMGWRCLPLCALRQRGDCDKKLCVLPTQVTGTGYCAAADDCHAVAPQSDCPNDTQGQPLGCYVLSDDKGGGTFCLRWRSYGDSSGELNNLCERSANCQPGLGCTTIGNRDAVCRPYCDYPIAPDGGTPPDLGGGIRCKDDLGACRPISNTIPYGRCY